MSIEEIITGLEYIAGVYFPESLEGKPDERHRRVLLEAIALLRTHPEAQTNEPLTLEELREMDGEAVYLAADHKWYIVSLKFPGPWGNNVPCGVDMWGAGTSLSLLARCGVYLRPPKED